MRVSDRSSAGCGCFTEEVTSYCSGIHTRSWISHGATQSGAVGGRGHTEKAREKERVRFASSRLQQRRRPEGAAPRLQPMMMIDAGRTHTPQPLSKIKSLFCKVVKEQNGTGLAAPLSLTAGVPFSVFSIIYSSGSRQRDSYTPLTQAHECAHTLILL